MGARKLKGLPTNKDGPSRLLRKLAQSLFRDVHEQESFIYALQKGAAGLPAIIWTARRHALTDADGGAEIQALETQQLRRAWHTNFTHVLTSQAEPGKLPLHEQGFYYCLDNSSLFEAAIVLGVKEECRHVVDVCAAPGGKSIYAWRRFAPQILICNEAIRSRVPALISNLKRCRTAPVYVSGFDSARLQSSFPSAFDLVLVDAPCSGQSLLARGVQSRGCFNPSVINMNANRQRRILANSAALAAKGAYVAYMTCTYSFEENEKVVGWFLKKFPMFTALEVPQLSEHASSLADFPCYRLFPQEGLGAGGFTALLRRKDGSAKQAINLTDWRFLWQAQSAAE